MKKIVSLVIITFVMLLACSCGPFKTYQDTNGDDNYTLQSITENEIINNTGGLKTAAVSNTKTKDGVTNITESIYRFDGIEKVYTFKKGSYAIKLSYTVKSGNGRLVITDGKKIIHDFLINEDNQEYEFEATSTSYLKLVGESCELQLEIEIIKK